VGSQDLEQPGLNDIVDGIPRPAVTEPPVDQREEENASVFKKLGQGPSISVPGAMQ
jgi:hypothetical protein